MFRCSICDRPETTFSYNNWHCSPCENAISRAVGNLYEEDFQEIVLGDEPEPTQQESIDYE